jgi:hypothetical protein
MGLPDPALAARVAEFLATSGQRKALMRLGKSVRDEMERLVERLRACPARLRDVVLLDFG